MRGRAGFFSFIAKVHGVAKLSASEILATESRHNTFVKLGEELWIRLMLPVGQFTYWTHLIIGVCFYGAIGVWTEVLRRYVLAVETDNANILLAMHSTYPAIIGATAMQLLLNNGQLTYVRAFAQLISTIFFSVAAVSILAANNISEALSFQIALLGNVCAILFWWIANARDEGLKDPANDALTSVGGPVPDEGPDLAPMSGRSVKTALGTVKL